jgi:hypothetical protein
MITLLPNLKNKHVPPLLLVLLFAFTSFTSFGQAPTISSFSPTTVTQRTSVVITGTGFTGVTAANVKFGGISATSIVVNSSTQITAIVGLGASGNVTVTNSAPNAGTATRSGLIYVAPLATPSNAGINRIITDYNGFWSTSTASVNPVKPDTRHNLMAFRYGNTLYSTGNEPAITSVLSNQATGGYTPGNFRALPINNINGNVPATNSTDPNLIVLASTIDGNAATQVPTAPGVAGLTVRDVLIDGIRGLDIGTGVTNFPKSSVLTFVATNILEGVISDAIPDILVSQIADPAQSDSDESDIYCFIDVNGNIVGNPVRISLNNIGELGRYKSDFFTLNANQSFNTSTINGSTLIGAADRPIRAVAYRLTDFGITEGNKAQAAFFKVMPSGKSDPAFIAYNRNSFNIPAPVITTEPVSQIKCPGSSATFTVVASGSELTYQWKKDGMDIPGATSASYTIANVQASDAAAYSVVVTNGAGSVFSANAYLNTTVTVQPVDTEACLNVPTALTVSANGASLQYQWYSNTTRSNTGGTLISGATSNSYSPSVTTAGTRYYYATIRNSNQTCTTVTTNAVAFTVSPASVAGTASGDVTICAGNIAQVFLTDNNGTIQWQSSPNGTSDWTDVTTGFGGTTRTYTTPAIASTTYYRAVVTSGACATSISNTVVVTVAQTNVWTGQVNKDWNTNGNWSCGSVPTLLLNVEIPAVNNVTNQPIVNFPEIDGQTGVANAKNVTIATNASIIVKGNGAGKLQIAGTITNNGTFNAVDGTIAMLGTSAQLVPENTFTTNTIRNFTVVNASGVTLGGPLDLTGILTLTTGSLNTNNVLTLKSNAATTAMIAPVTGSVNGTMTIERFIPARRGFRLISSPVNGGSIQANWQEGKPVVDPVGYGTDITGTGAAASGFDVSGSNNPSLFEFTNQTGTWSAIENTITTNLVAGKPLRLLVRGDRRIDQTSNFAVPTNTTLRSTGTIRTGDVVITDFRPVAYRNNFIGNPYQAPVNMQSVLNNGTNVIKNFFYVWDPKMGGATPTVGQPGGRGAYVTVLLAPNGSSSNTANGSAASKYLQPNQACFVRTLNNGPASITFRESYKDMLTNVTPQLYRTGDNNNSARIALQLYHSNALALNETPNDGLIVEFGSALSNDLDEYDAEKMTNQDENVAILNGTKKLSVERRNLPQVNEVLPLYNSDYTRTNYTYVVQTEGIEGVTAYLLDKYTNTSTELQAGETTYNFTVNPDDAASISENRFDITFGEESLGNKNFTTGDDVRIYPNPAVGNNFFVDVPFGSNDTAVTIYNALGQKVASSLTVQSDTTLAVKAQTQMAAGIYMIEIAQGQKVITKKLIIK